MRQGNASREKEPHKKLLRRSVSENKLWEIARKAGDMNRSYSEEYRNGVKTTLDQLEALIPDVKRCADSTGQINELAGRRDILNSELKSQHATLGPEKLKNLKGRISKLRRQVEDLYKPLPETERKIFAFVTGLEHALMSCPLEKSFLDIRSELRQLGLMSISKTSAQVRFNNAYRDLLIVQLRLREMSSFLNRSGVSRKLSLRIPPGTTWANVTIRFLSDNRIQITALKWSEPLDYAEAGFEDTRNHVPNLAWKVLRDFAIHSGELQRPNGLRTERRQLVSLETSVGAIRKRFKQLFGIDEDPFSPYKEMRCYRTKFKISFPNSECN